MGAVQVGSKVQRGSAAQFNSTSQHFSIIAAHDIHERSSYEALTPRIYLWLSCRWWYLVDIVTDTGSTITSGCFAACGGRESSCVGEAMDAQWCHDVPSFWTVRSGIPDAVRSELPAASLFR